MAAHSSILAWEIPWTEEPDWHSSWGHKGVRHDLVTKQQQQQVLWQAFCNTHMHQITFHLISQSSKKLKNKQNLCISYTTANLVIFSFPSVKRSLRFLRLHIFQGIQNLPKMQEMWVQSLCQEDTPEKGIATHSSILAWRIPWIEEPGRLQSTGSQRVGHN